MNEQKTSVTAIVGLILAIIGVLLSAIPIINNFAFVLAVLGIALGVMGLIKTKKGKRSGSKVAISAIIISIIAFIIVLVSQSIYGAALNEVSKSLDKSVSDASGDNTADILKNSVDVTLGTFTTETDQYGLNTTSLPVTVKNKLSESKSYSIQIEAVDASGKRITEDYIYANDLGSQQTQDFKIFQYIESGKLEQMKTAKFKIVKVSQT